MISNRLEVKLIDFGIAGGPFLERITDGPAPGTRGYMSPAQINGEKAQPHFDQFAFAVIADEFLRRRVLQIPPALEDAIRKAKSPDSCFPTCGDLVSELDRALSLHLALDRHNSGAKPATTAPITTNFSKPRKQSVRRPSVPRVVRRRPAVRLMSRAWLPV